MLNCLRCFASVKPSLSHCCVITFGNVKHLMYRLAAHTNSLSKICRYAAIKKHIKLAKADLLCTVISKYLFWAVDSSWKLILHFIRMILILSFLLQVSPALSTSQTWGCCPEDRGCSQSWQGLPLPALDYACPCLSKKVKNLIWPDICSVLFSSP